MSLRIELFLEWKPSCLTSAILGRVFQLGGDNVERKSQRWNRGLLVHVAGLAVAFVLMFQFPDSAYAQSVNLAWDTSSDTTVVGYKMYRSEQSGSYTSPI